MLLAKLAPSTLPTLVGVLVVVCVTLHTDKIVQADTSLNVPAWLTVTQRVLAYNLTTVDGVLSFASHTSSTHPTYLRVSDNLFVMVDFNVLCTNTGNKNIVPTKHPN